MCEMTITVHHVCLYNLKLNHMCLRIILLVFCEDTDAHTMNINLLFVIFYWGGGGGGDMLNANHVTGIGTWDGSSKLICIYE